MIEEMAEAVEIRDDQVRDFVKAQVQFESTLVKTQLQMQFVGRDRQKRMSLVRGLTDAQSTAAKTIKEILDKNQMKLYTAKMKERVPQQRGRGGRGR